MKQLFLFVLLILISSQARGQKEDINYYAPTNIASVGLENKNGFQVKGNTFSVIPLSVLGTKQVAPLNKRELNISWSPFKHLGIYFNRHSHGEVLLGSKDIQGEGYFGPWESNISTYHRFNSLMNEFGMGYYHKLNSKLSIEFYGFYGGGKGKHSTSDKEFEIDSLNQFNYNMSKSGLRGSLTAHNGKSDIGLSMAFSQLKFSQIENTYAINYYSRYRYLTKRLNQNLMQAAVFYKIHLAFLEFRAEIGCNASMSKKQFRQNNMYASIGVGINVQSMSNKKLNKSQE